MRRWLIVVLLGGTVACGSRDGAQRDGVLHLVHDGGCTVSAPDRPGFTEVTLLNSTDRGQRATLVRLEDSTADSTVLSWYAGSDSTFPSGANWIGGPGLTLPGSSTTVTLHLSVGRYAAFCLPAEPERGVHSVPPMALFGIDSLSPPFDPEPPLTDAILQIGEDGVAWIPTPASGRRLIRIVNQGMESITVSLTRIGDAGRVELLGGITELGAGREGWITVTFRPGPHRVTVVGDAGRAPEVVTGFVIE